MWLYAYKLHSVCLNLVNACVMYMVFHDALPGALLLKFVSSFAVYYLMRPYNYKYDCFFLNKMVGVLRLHIQMFAAEFLLVCVLAWLFSKCV